MIPVPGGLVAPGRYRSYQDMSSFPGGGYLLVSFPTPNPEGVMKQNSSLKFDDECYVTRKRRKTGMFVMM